MYTKEQIEETCKGMPWLAYQQGLQDGYDSAFHGLRNQAAISAMQGILCGDNPMSACAGTAKESGTPLQVVVANYAISCADALVKVLKEKQP